MSEVKIGDVITRSDGQKYIIFDNSMPLECLSPDILRLSSDSTLAQNLLGSSVGDSFNFSSKYSIQDITPLSLYLKNNSKHTTNSDRDGDYSDDILSLQESANDYSGSNPSDIEELEHEANSVNDEKALTEDKINPVRAEYEELKKTPEFRKWRAKQYTIQKGHCAYCYQVYPSSRLQVDHITPICHGGKNEYSNFVLACRYCNEKLKYTSAFNRVSYFRAKKRIKNNPSLRSRGYVPIKIFWKRPKWIPPNPYCSDSVEYDSSIPEDERDVWDYINPIAPISMVSSIKQEDIEDFSGFVAKEQEVCKENTRVYAGDTLLDGVNNILEFIFDNLGKVIIALIIIFIIGFIIYYSNWQKEHEGKAPSTIKSDTAADCGCGEELICYSDEYDNSECHCVYKYSSECED